MLIRRFLAAIAATALIVAACGSDSDDRRYSQEVRNLYLQGCMQEGEPAFCECTLEELEARYTEEEFVRFSMESATDDDVPIDVIEVAVACLRVLE